MKINDIKFTKDITALTVEYIECFNSYVDNSSLTSKYISKFEKDYYVLNNSINSHPKYCVDMIEDQFEQPNFKNRKMIIHTFSPYIIKAILVYSEKYNHSLDFYMVRENGSVDLLTDDMNTVFTQLNKPFHDLMFSDN